jgi:hypothetical protein
LKIGPGNAQTGRGCGKADQFRDRDAAVEFPQMGAGEQNDVLFSWLKALLRDRIQGFGPQQGMKVLRCISDLIVRTRLRIWVPRS